jgi:hypothetical protein
MNTENNENAIIKQYFENNQNLHILENTNIHLNNEKNQKWIVFDDNLKEEYIIMFCNKEYFTKISIGSLELVQLFTTSWRVDTNGYVLTTVTKKSNPLDFHFNGMSQGFYLHIILMNRVGNSNKNEGITHINNDKLDNRINNLTVSSFSTINSYGDKKNRKKSAVELNEKIDHFDIPKYTSYIVEYKKETDELGNKITSIDENGKKVISREFFLMEHPKEGKRWATTKSSKVSIEQKLQDAKNHFHEIETLHASNSLKII